MVLTLCLAILPAWLPRISRLVNRKALLRALPSLAWAGFLGARRIRSDNLRFAAACPLFRGRAKPVSRYTAPLIPVPQRELVKLPGRKIVGRSTMTVSRRDVLLQGSVIGAGVIAANT